MAYNVEVLNLSAVTDATRAESGVELFGRGERFSEVVVLAIPEGNKFELRYGTNPWFEVPRAFTSQPKGDDGNAGLYWRNKTAQPGVIVQMIVTRGSGELDTVLA